MIVSFDSRYNQRSEKFHLKRYCIYKTILAKPAFVADCKPNGYEFNSHSKDINLFYINILQGEKVRR